MDDTVKYGADDGVGFLPGNTNGLTNLLGQIGPGHLARPRSITKKSSTGICAPWFPRTSLEARYASVMDVRQILAQLFEGRDQLDEAILSLERLSAGQGKRRGRPPAWLKNVKEASPEATEKPKRRGRPPGKKNQPKDKPVPEPSKGS